MGNTKKEAILEVKDLNLYFPLREGLLNRVVGTKKVVNNVSFQIGKGETLALVGESGCGKTELIRAILDIDPKTSGQILYNGKNTDEMTKEEKRSMLFHAPIIFQDTGAALHPRMTIEETLEEPLILSGWKDAEKRKAEVKRIMDQVGLDESFLKRYPHQISGGQRQRVVIARALIVQPEIILADEPISALDVSLQAQIINLLIDLQEEYNMGILLIAHDLAIVRQIANNIMIMYLGKIMESAPAQEIYKNAKHPYTKVLLTAAPSITRGIRDMGFQLDLKVGDTPDMAHPPKGCPFCTRCIFAEGRCLEEDPKEEWITEEHMVRCHRWKELEGK